MPQFCSKTNMRCLPAESAGRWMAVPTSSAHSVSESNYTHAPFECKWHDCGGRFVTLESLRHHMGSIHLSDDAYYSSNSPSQKAYASTHAHYYGQESRSDNRRFPSPYLGSPQLLHHGAGAYKLSEMPLPDRESAVNPLEMLGHVAVMQSQYMSNNDHVDRSDFSPVQRAHSAPFGTTAPQRMSAFAMASPTLPRNTAAYASDSPATSRAALSNSRHGDAPYHSPKYPRRDGPLGSSKSAPAAVTHPYNYQFGENSHHPHYPHHANDASAHESPRTQYASPASTHQPTFNGGHFTHPACGTSPKITRQRQSETNVENNKVAMKPVFGEPIAPNHDQNFNNRANAASTEDTVNNSTSATAAADEVEMKKSAAGAVKRARCVSNESVHGEGDSEEHTRLFQFCVNLEPLPLQAMAGPLGLLHLGAGGN